VVARYKLCADGRIECFEVLDAVLWPNLSMPDDGVGECNT